MTVETETPRLSKAAVISGWIIGVLPVLLLLFSAIMKLSKSAGVVKGFAQFGYPEHLLVPIGITEFACTILYLIPQTAVLGAILLTGYFGGAVATQVRVSDPTFILPALCGVLLWLGLFLRDRRLRALVPFR